MGDKITEPARDPFAIARHDADGDARVLALFHDWIEACRAANRRYVGDDDDGHDAAFHRQVEIEEKIVATSGGPVALAVKTYLILREDLGIFASDVAMLRCPKLLEGDPDLTVSLLRDAARLVPELAELAAPIIHEDAVLIDADIEVQWCREMLSPGFEDDRRRRAEVVEQLSQVLARIAKTDAKTPTGEAIKSKHAGIDDQQKAELRARAEAIAAEFDPATLPGGDAGLIEAQRRLRAFRSAMRALDRQFGGLNFELERDVMIPIRDPVDDALCHFMERTAPETRAGAIVKLRHVVNDEGDDDDTLPQVLDLLEREARS